MPELENQDVSSAGTTGTCYVVKLREALLAAAETDSAADTFSPRRDTRLRQVDRAVQPLIDEFSAPLLRHCDGLARTSKPLRNHADGSDIAQDAWAKMLRYLKGPNGSRVQSDSHFFRLLRAAATTRFLDLRQETPPPPALLNENSSRRGQPVSQPPQSDAFSPFGDDQAAELIELLFTNEEAFRRRCRHPIRRRLAHYRAFVLYQLGQFLHSEAIVDDPDGISSSSAIPEMVDLTRQYVNTLAIPSEHWSAVETVVLSHSTTPDLGSLPLRLIDTVNRLFDARLKLGNTMSVLRHEMNGFLK